MNCSYVLATDAFMYLPQSRALWKLIHCKHRQIHILLAAVQALRHLYVVATEPRCVEAIDVDSRQSVYVPLSVSTDATTNHTAEQVP